jgi:phosphoglycolate phosphatase-like HAD superfamily hydrolase
MSDPTRILKEFKPTKAFFIGIDSDGCIFDSMEIKHKECFTPMFIKHFHLQAVSKYARECWDFVNLYSKTRGTNRFPALVRAVKLLGERPPVQARGVKMPDLTALEEWSARETKLGNATLNAEVKNGNTSLAQVKVWSDAVNQSIADLVQGVPPFPRVRECLQELSARADAMCISQTPAEALQREWAEHGLDQFVKVIAGQEMGTKTEHLQYAAAGKYAPQNILMIGDAPGDFNAAKKNGALFFPVVPGHEEDSWKRLYDEALDRFFAGKYAGAYEAALVKEFDDRLPEKPNW